MRRRDLLGLLTSLPVVTGLAKIASAQSTAAPTLGLFSLHDGDTEQFAADMRRELTVLGYREGSTLKLDVRSAHGDTQKLAEIAAAFIALRVAAIAAYQTPAALAAKQATTTVPVIMSAADPVGSGVVTSLARPGGNVTGTSNFTAELVAKNIEVLHEALPAVRHITIVINAADPFTPTFLEHAKAAARTLGLDHAVVSLMPPDQLEHALASVSKMTTGAIVVQPSLPRRVAFEFGLRAGLPVISPISGTAAEGALFSYAANRGQLSRRMASAVDKVLRGAKPADLPVEQPTEFVLSINLQTAQAIGVTIAPTMLARANEVIE